MYTEGDAGDGATGNALLLPNGNDAPTDWTAFGCAEASEYQCVDEGPTHDSDTTYVFAAQTITTVNSRYALQDCTGQAWCTGAAVLTAVTEWAYARFVAGVNTDPGIELDIWSGGISCEGVSTNNALTTTYTNITDGDPYTCPLTVAVLDTLVLSILTTCPLNPCDQERVTAGGLTIGYTLPNYRSTVLYEFSGLELGRSTIADFRAAASAGESYSWQVYDWSAAAWNTRTTVTGATLTDYTYELAAESEIASDGTVRVRWADATQTGDTTQGTLTVDYAALRSTTLSGGNPGGPNPLRADCTYDWLFQVASCRDASNWSAAAQVEWVCMSLDGGPEQCTTQYGTVRLPSGDPWWSLSLVQHRLRMRAGVGSTVEADFPLGLDNFPRILIWLVIAVLVLLAISVLWRRFHPRRGPIDPWGGG